MSSPSGLNPLWLICLALVLGVTIVTLIPVSISGGDTIKGSDWIGFAGSVLGGAMTIIAALIAWYAVQAQISAHERALDRTERQRRAEKEDAEKGAKACAVAALDTPLDVTAQLFAAIKASLDATTSDETDYWTRSFFECGELLRETLDGFTLKVVAGEMNAADRIQYLGVLAELSALATLLKIRPKNISHARLLRHLLSKEDDFVNAVKGLDMPTAAKFMHFALPETQRTAHQPSPPQHPATGE